MEVLVKHLVLQTLLHSALQTFEENNSCFGTGLFHSPHMIFIMIKFDEHKVSIWKLGLQLSDGKTLYMHEAVVVFYKSSNMQSLFYFSPVSQCW